MPFIRSSPLQEFGFKISVRLHLVESLNYSGEGSAVGRNFSATEVNLEQNSVLTFVSIELSLAPSNKAAPVSIVEVAWLLL